jgi:hypothetical protein
MLLIVVWDMNRVQQLSSVIHNDHSSMWVDMNRSTMERTYSPFALCVINTSVTTPEIPGEEIRQHCSHLHKREKMPLPFCAVGYSLGKECTGSLRSQSNYYLRTLRDPQFSFAADALPSLIHSLALRNWTIIFIGDKLSLQNMNALLCALEERSHGHISVTMEGAGNFSVAWKSDSPAHIRISFVSLRGILSKQKIRPGLLWNASGASNLAAAQQKVASLLDQHGSAIIVANAGSFYNTRVQFREEAPYLLKWLNSLGQDNLVFFRESASQHWNNTRNGYYLAQKGSANAPLSCMPNIDSSPVLDWRNSDAKAIATSFNLHDINWLSFHDVTAPLYNMHPFGGDARNTDCTQYCYFPEMWQPIWKQFIDNILKSKIA